MDVVALVDHVQAARIRQALSPEDTFTHVCTWDSLFGHLAGWNGGAVIVNPCVGDAHSRGSERAAEASTIHRLRTTAFVVYVRLADLRSVTGFLREGATDVLLKDHTDSRAEIRDALRSTQNSTGELILRRILDALVDRHPGVGALFAELFRHPHAVATAAALTHRTTFSERTLYREVTEAGLAPLAVIVRAARAARAFDLIRHHKFTLERAANTLGYSSPRQLSGHLRDITGHRSVVASTSVTQSQFLEAALRQLFRRSEEVAS